MRRPPDFAALRNGFSGLRKGTNRGKPLIYLDSAASAQKPDVVIDAMSDFYHEHYANIHRGIYELSARATQQYENARDTVRDFMHARDSAEIVFVRGATEGINLVAQSFGRSQLKANDEIIVSEMEYHSNIVPWQLLKDQLGLVIKVIPVLDDGSLDLAAYASLLTPRTRLVAITHASNVLGTLNPIEQIAAMAHAHGAVILVDGAQAITQLPVDVQKLDCDFYVFSAHKLYGPTGTGVLYGKKTLLDAMPPWQGGGGMIETVSFADITYAKTPQKFEAGTPDITGVCGLAAAIHWLQSIGMEAVCDHAQTLLKHAEAQLASIQGLRIIGTAHPKVAVISFVMDNIHAHDIGTVLDHEGIAIRAGHHCAMPLMQRFKVPAAVRVSFGIYNNHEEIDALMDAIHLTKRVFR